MFSPLTSTFVFKFDFKCFVNNLETKWLPYELQVNVALQYFEAREPWEKLLVSDQTAAKKMYWIIAGKIY